MESKKSLNNDVSVSSPSQKKPFTCLSQDLFIFIAACLLIIAGLTFYFFNMYPPLVFELHRQRSFIIDRERGIFLKDGEPFRYISGSMHYFRIPKIYWGDRLLKAKAAGLTAIQTYVPWNFHESSPGIYNFHGGHDIYEFISLAQEVGLLVLVRAGPYICSEWDFGGLPAWLLTQNPNIKLRTSDPDFLHPTIRWFGQLLPRLRPLLYENGGPIIMIQLENEYGFHPACDKAYLTSLYEFSRFSLGDKVILYTTDGTASSLISCGSSDRRLFTTVDFGVDGASNLNERFRNLENFQPNHPLVNSEYYSGWIDHWGEKRHTVSADAFVRGVEHMWNFSNRVSFNFYMFHGGTNFKYWNGKNSDSEITITSYDFDGPLSEAGDITIKYEMLRDSIQKLTGATLPPTPPNVTKAHYGTVSLDLYSHLLYRISGGVQNDHAKSMEDLGYYKGFLAYTTSVENYIGSQVLSFSLARDVQHVFTADLFFDHLIYHGSVRLGEKLLIRVDKDHPYLSVLSESQGHLNFGIGMNTDLKGIIGGAFLNGTELFDWTMKEIEIRDVIPFSPKNSSTSPQSVRPARFLENFSDGNSDFPDTGKILRGVLFIPSNSGSPKDTFARLSGFKRGILIINDQIMGRYFPSAGPQVSLYIPASALVLGNNSVTVLELDALSENCHSNHSVCSVTFQDSMVWLN